MPRNSRPSTLATTVARDAPVAISTGFVSLHDEPDGSTSVWVNNVPSSRMRVEPDVLDFEYMRHMAAAIDAWRPPATMLALHVGAAACTLPRYLVHRYPTSRHIAVDVDTMLTTLARTWWDLPRAPQLRIRAQDGLAAVATRHDDSLDLVVRDAFAGDRTPAHLSDDTWWAHARRAVRPDGLVVANVATVPGTDLGRADAVAARAHFRQVVAIAEHAVLKGKRRGNVILAAGSAIEVDVLRRYAASAPLPTGIAPNWRR